MIQEFENRLATVLGNQLNAPFNDRVFVAGTEPDDTDAKILLGAVHHQPWMPEFATSKPERIPGQADFRRVLRLEVEVLLDLVSANSQGRPQRRQGFDALIYLLEQPDLADGSGLAQPGDQGFFIEAMKLSHSDLPLTASADNPARVRLIVHGWFWPVGLPGQAGIAIAETHIRAVNLDVNMVPERPEILAGGPAVSLQLQIGNTGFILADSQAPQTLGLDFLALSLRAAGGGPGIGGLSGDAQGASGLTLVNVSSDGTASFTYTPPAQPGEDILLVSIAGGGLVPAEKQAGKILTKLSLTVGAP